MFAQSNDDDDDDDIDNGRTFFSFVFSLLILISYVSIRIELNIKYENVINPVSCYS